MRANKLRSEKLTLNDKKWALRGMKSIVRQTLERCGLAINSTAKVGLDPFRDVATLARQWSRPIEIIFDVGANDGDTSAQLAQRFPPAQIHAFEPNPDTFRKLSRRFPVSPRIQPHALALGPHTETRELNIFDDGKLCSLRADTPFALEYGKQSVQIPVSCTSVDTFCARNGIARIDLLKIDTEGFDADVLLGAESMLARKAIGFVYCEFNTLFADDNQPGELVPIGRMLARFGLRFVTAYVDYIHTHKGMFMVSNALFALPGPEQGKHN